ncbi:hypothetical protein [Deinococcus kurensis]|uniref:hypothetical protein n=1 Tax=Deinococcus kurensis TaxID=2662757 RepID=UPI0012D33ABF|nr:hypothetical protein [Deinococcus kurensis]
MNFLINNAFPAAGSFSTVTQGFSAIQGVLTTGGLVRLTSADFAALATPTASGVVATEVYRFDDPAQASAPVFLEVGYRVFYGGATSMALGLSIRVGRGFDGAALSGALGADRYASLAYASSSEVFSAYVGVDAGAVLIALRGSSGNNQFSLLVQRLADPATGAVGMHALVAARTSTAYGGVTSESTGDWSVLCDLRLGVETRSAVMPQSLPVPTGMGRAADGTRMLLTGPTFGQGGRLFTLAHPGGLTVTATSDAAPGGLDFTATLYGTQRSFLVHPVIGVTASLTFGSGQMALRTA